jgi:hypothetical protein
MQKAMHKTIYMCWSECEKAAGPDLYSVTDFFPDGTILPVFVDKIWALWDTVLG